MSDNFNPDSYLASKQSAEFNPDAYLSSKNISTQPEVSKLESLGRGALQGASFGFADEGTGVLESLWDKMSGDEKSKTFTELYKQHRDEARASNEAASKANPASYTTGQIGGGIASAVATAGMAPEIAGVGGAVKAGAAGGAVQGLGDSTADSIGGDIQNTAMGAGIGGITGGVVHGAVEGVIKPILNNGTEMFNKGVSKIGSLATGADQEALLRQIQRPAQSALAEADGFANQLGQQGKNEVAAFGEKVGQSVGNAKDAFLKYSGNDDMGGIGQKVAGSIDDFLGRHEISPMGFSALDKNETSTLENLANNLRSSKMSGDDLLKSREYLDHVENLAKKYDKDGTGPFTNFLKQLRGQLDDHLDMLSPDIDKANTNYSSFLDDKKALGLNNNSNGETVISNLYGKNKTAAQEAAQRLLSPDTMTKTLDIEANKAIAGAQGPAGSAFGARRMGGHMMAGFGLAHGNLPMAIASEAVVSPQTWKAGLRALGTAEQKIGLVLEKAPDILGKYAPILQQAQMRGEAALASTHFLLQQNDPQYRKLLKNMDDENGR
jgi:hypothetical protein